MGTEPLERKLAAILYADVTGYSRLTGEDEEGTHRTLSAYLDAITASIKSYHGTVMHFAGDAVLAEFSAVSDALACAIDSQHELKDRNSALPENRRVQFRMGVNLGEVIVDRGEIYGDGVNVSARLESLAEPGGICLSESVHTVVGNKLPLDYEDLGEQSVKNIEKPVRAYAARLKPGATRPAPRAKRRRTLRPVIVVSAAALLVVAIGVVAWRAPWISTTPVAPEDMRFSLPNKPSIAVLPFDNLSDDQAQEYFSDGITNDIITDLSKFSSLFVIASNSVFAYKDKSVKVQEVSQELGVRYVLEGSVQRAGEKVFGGPIAVALELSKGPLVSALQRFDFLVLIPVNPSMLAKYREAFTPSGAKDDPTDAALAVDLVVRHPERFKPLQPQSAEMRTLVHLVEKRRRLVEDRRRFSNRLS